MKIEELFFQLLQVAVGDRNTLDRMPSTEEWVALFDLAKKQALVAIAVTGVTRLIYSIGSRAEESDFGASIGMDEVTYLKWLGLTAKVVQRNKELNTECDRICKELAHDGLNCVVIKGQGNQVYYPEELREFRTAGDIDVWCQPMDPCGMDIPVMDLDGRGAHYEKYVGNRGVIEYAHLQHRILNEQLRHEGKKEVLMPEVCYHHTTLPEETWGDVELHYRPSFDNVPLVNWRMQRWFRENEQWGMETYAPAEGLRIPVPTVSFNAVYQMIHIYRHLFHDGIGLRQLLDYYFVLRSLHVAQGEFADATPSMSQWAEGMGRGVRSNEEIMRTLSRFGMKEFASAVMYVLQKVFAMPTEYMLCEPDERRGCFLLNEIMLAGNFGEYDERNTISAHEGYVSRFLRRQKRFLRFITQYPSEVIWGPYFSIKQRLWRMAHGWR